MMGAEPFYSMDECKHEMIKVKKIPASTKYAVKTTEDANLCARCESVNEMVLR